MCKIFLLLLHFMVQAMRPVPDLYTHSIFSKAFFSIGIFWVYPAQFLPAFFYQSFSPNLLSTAAMFTYFLLVLTILCPTCGGGLEYLHRSPESRRRRWKGNPVPRGITGQPVTGGHKYRDLVLQVGESDARLTTLPWKNYCYEIQRSENRMV
jgi:hypothetical protein